MINTSIFILRSPLSLLAEDCAADYHAKNFTGAFANLKELGVSDKALNMEFFAVAVAAENLEALKTYLNL